MENGDIVYSMIAGGLLMQAKQTPFDSIDAVFRSMVAMRDALAEIFPITKGEWEIIKDKACDYAYDLTSPFMYNRWVLCKMTSPNTLEDL